jgi:hypothetical protein
MRLRFFQSSAIAVAFVSIWSAPAPAPAQKITAESGSASRSSGTEERRSARSPSDIGSARAKILAEFLAGRLDDAMAETERAIDLAREVRGDSHPDLALLKVVLACFRESRGDYATARDLFREALEILERDPNKTSSMASQVRASLAQAERFAACDEMTRSRTLDYVGSVALVVTREPIGSAFCVDSRGLFVTTADLVADLAPAVTTEFVRAEARILGTRINPAAGEVPLALRMHTPGGLGPRLRARVIRVDRAHNLALLTVRSDHPLRRLELAPGPPLRGTTVTALTEVTVGIAEARSMGLPLRFTVPYACKIETVRMRGGKCWLMTLDQTPGEGPGGWPVLDGQGRLVGVLFNGLPGTGVHYVCPAAVLAEFLGAAQMVFEPPLVPFLRRKERVSWEVAVWGSQPLPATASLEISVGEGAARRLFAAERSGKDRFTAHVHPVAPEAAVAVDLIATNAQPPTRWRVGDGEISIGEKRLRLSEVRLLRPGESPAGYDTDGRPLFGLVAGLEGLRPLRDQSPGGIGFARAGSLSVEFPTEAPGPVACEAVLRDGERVLDRVPFALQLRDPATDVLGSLKILDRALQGAGRSVGDAPVGNGNTQVPKARLATGSGAANADAIRIVRAIAYTPDGRSILVGGDDKIVHVWDPAAHREVRQMRGHTGTVVDLAVTPNGRHALSASLDGTIRVWDLVDGKEARVLRGHRAGVRCLAVSPDGRLAASGGDGKDKPLRVWEIETGREIAAFAGHGAHVFAVAFLPDNHRFLSAGDDSKVRLWDVRTSREIRSFGDHNGDVYGLAVSADGAVAISSGQDVTLRFWNIETGSLLRKKSFEHTAAINRVALVADGRTVVTAAEEGQVSVFSPSQGRIKHYRCENLRWKALAVSPDGRTAAFGGTADSILLLDLHGNFISHLPALPQANVSRDTEGGGKERRTPSRPTVDRSECLRLPGVVNDLAVGGCGRYLLLAMGQRREIAVFDTSTAEVLDTIPIAAEHVLVAAGAEKAVLVYPGLGFIHRIDLGTLALDGQARIPVNGRVSAVAMGSDSAGPILAAWSPSHHRDPHTKHYFSLISLDTLKVLDIRSVRVGAGNPQAKWLDDWGGLAPIRGVIVPFELGGRGSLHLRASSGGDLFGLWDTGNSPDGFATIALRKDEVRVFYEGSTSLHVVPGPDGRAVYTGALGRVEPEGKPLSRLGEWVAFPRMIPSTDPKLYLGVSLPASDPKGPKVVLTFHEAGTDRVLGHLDEPFDDFFSAKDPVERSATDGTRALDFDRRFLWVPTAQLLVMIPPTDDRLILRRVDSRALSGATHDETGVKP